MFVEKVIFVNIHKNTHLAKNILAKNILPILG